jgi:hypothetical protein
MLLLLPSGTPQQKMKCVMNILALYSTLFKGIHNVVCIGDKQNKQEDDMWHNIGYRILPLDSVKPR